MTPDKLLHQIQSSKSYSLQEAWTYKDTRSVSHSALSHSVAGSITCQKNPKPGNEWGARGGKAQLIKNNITTQENTSHSIVPLTINTLTKSNE